MAAVLDVNIYIYRYRYIDVNIGDDDDDENDVNIYRHIPQHACADVEDVSEDQKRHEETVL